jgi:hypothetical protein
MTERIALGRVHFEFTQDGDCCGPVDDVQQINIEIEDGGGGKYLVLSTERWAVDSPKELEKLLTDVLKSLKDMKTVFEQD